MDEQLAAMVIYYQLTYPVRRVELSATPVTPSMKSLGTIPSQSVLFKIESNYTKGVQVSFRDVIQYGYAKYLFAVIHILTVTSSLTCVADPLAASAVIAGKLASGTETTVAASVQYPGTFLRGEVGLLIT